MNDIEVSYIDDSDKIAVMLLTKKAVDYVLRNFSRCPVSIDPNVGDGLFFIPPAGVVMLMTHFDSVGMQIGLSAEMAEQFEDQLSDTLVKFVE